MLIWYNREISRRATGNNHRWIYAVQLFDRMKVEGITPTPETYRHVLRACEKGLDWHRTRILLSEMGAAGIQPDVGMTNSVATILCRSKKYKEVLELLENLYVKGCVLRASTFNIIMGSMVSELKWREVIKLFELMKAYRVRYDGPSYSYAITAQVSPQK